MKHLQENNIEPVTVSGAIQSSLIAGVLGMIFAAIIWIPAALTVKVLGWVFGVKDQEKEADRAENEIALQLSEFAKTSTPEEIPESHIIDGDLDLLRAQVEEFLVQEYGFTELVAKVMASVRERLTFEKEEWEATIKATKALLAQGIPEEPLLLHLKVSLMAPTLSRVQLLEHLVQEGMEGDMSLFHKVLNHPDFSRESVEKIIEFHHVRMYSWRVAVQWALG